MSPPVARSPLAPTQVALYERLSGDAALTGMVGVYDHIPEDADYPYVTIGEAVRTPRNTHGGYGAETVHTLHVWYHARVARGFYMALLAEDRITQLLDHQHEHLTVEGHTVVSCRHETTVTLRDPDPAIRHVAISFRITTEQEG